MTVRCLVGLYGLNRSLRWTAPSINRKILKPLHEAKAQVRCIAHFNEPDVVRNDHSGEQNIKITRHGLREIELDGLLFEPQSEARLPASALKAIDAVSAGPRGHPPQTMVHLLAQLYSVSQLWKIIKLTPDRHDVYLFVRPDLEYLDALEPALVFDQILNNGVDLITASWDQFGGLNDRFAFCSAKGAEAFAQRINVVDRFCAENGYLHAESLLRSAANWADLKLSYTGMRAMRVRADGGTVREGFTLSPGVLARGVVRKRVQKIRRALGRS